MAEFAMQFTQRSLAEALNNVRCMYDLGPELIAEQVFAASAQQPTLTVPEGWKLVPVDPTEEMLSAMIAYDGNYYTHPFDEDDFAKDYAALLAAAPAALVAMQEPGEDWDGEVYIGSRTPSFTAPPAAEQTECSGCRALSAEIIALRTGKTFCGACRDGCHSCEVEESAPPAAEQPKCLTCSGHGVVGGFVSADSGYDAQDCPECGGSGSIHGTECGACAEQPTGAMQALATISRMARNEACRSGAPAAGQLCTWDAIADMADAALAAAPAAEQPDTVKVPRDVLRACRESLAGGLETAGSAEAEWSTKDRALVARIDALLAGGEA